MKGLDVAMLLLEAVSFSEIQIDYSLNRPSAAHFKGTCFTVPRMVFLVFTKKCTKNQPEGKSMN